MIIAPATPQVLSGKVLGCWVGKNCGGTLGGPLEKPYSEEKPFDVSFYPVINEGGIPNDDLELQLIWLKALEEKGIGLTARDLAQYWIDHVAYNFDEYGLMQANFRLGLHPPVSGFYNNFFKHSMGCPIRTEIWACIAPGNPRLAARYAFEDSICDHGGGESINGSLFNVTVESAAFVLSDPGELIEIGLSYLPENSLTARCIQEAVEAHRSGAEWLEARRRVIAVGGSPIAQFSPPNIAFQVIGWLYGVDFGDALCKAVNCGYDTDCTGATLGAILGIIAGEENLPKTWKAPLGMAIATNEAAGGLRHLSNVPNPVPKTIIELTERVLRVQREVEGKFGPPSHVLKDLYANESILREVALPATRVDFPISPKITLQIDYQSTPQICAGEDKAISVQIKHAFGDSRTISLSIETPEGWSCSPSPMDCHLEAGKPWRGSFILNAPGRAQLLNRNEVLLRLSSRNLPTLASTSLAFVGAPVYQCSPIFFADGGRDAVALLAQPFEPEELLEAPGESAAEKHGWHVIHADGHDVGASMRKFSKGVVYLRRFLKSATAQSLWMHTCSTVPAKVWLNGNLAFNAPWGRQLRPAAWGTREGGLHGEIALREGWNEFLFKFAADSTTPPFDCHILCSDHRNLEAVSVDLLWTQFPWDAHVKRE